MSPGLVPHFFRCFKILPLFAFLFNSAYAIDKCVVDGKVTYTDRECPATAIITPFDHRASPPNDPAAAHQRYLDDKNALQQINRQRAQEQAQLQRAQQHAAWQANVDKEHQIRCSNLDMRRQIANQQLADAKLHGNQKKMNQTELRVSHAEKTYAIACKTE